MLLMGYREIWAHPVRNAYLKDKIEVMGYREIWAHPVPIHGDRTGLSACICLCRRYRRHETGYRSNPLRGRLRGQWS